MLLLNDDIEIELSSRGLTVAGTHPSKLSPKYTDQNFVRDCWVLDEKENVILTLFFFTSKFQNDAFIKNRVLQLDKNFMIGKVKFFFGVISSDHHLINNVKEVIGNLDINNEKYDDYSY